MRSRALGADLRPSFSTLQQLFDLVFANPMSSFLLSRTGYQDIKVESADPETAHYRRFRQRHGAIRPITGDFSSGGCRSLKRDDAERLKQPPHKISATAGCHNRQLCDKARW